MKYLCYNIEWDVNDRDDLIPPSSEMTVEIDESAISEAVTIPNLLSDKLSESGNRC
jgi:hypothetical protein